MSLANGSSLEQSPLKIYIPVILVKAIGAVEVRGHPRRTHILQLDLTSDYFY